MPLLFNVIQQFKSRRLRSRWSVLSFMLIAGAGLALLFIRLDGPAGKIRWEHRLPIREYVLCLATRDGTGRPIVIAGVQKNNYGSRDFDNYIVCLDLATGAELWRRLESKAGKIRGWKRPSSMGFDGSGNLIVGWDYLAVGEGEFELVSKLSAMNGTVIWDWTAPSQGRRPGGTGYSHDARIFCDGADVLVKAKTSVGTRDGNPDMQEFYSVIDSNTGAPTATVSSSSATAEVRWRAKENSLRFVAPDGSEIVWAIHPYEHTDTNWFQWHKEDGLWLPETHWERRERVQVTRTSPHSRASPEQFFVGRDQERVLLLLYENRGPIPSAALLIDMSEKAESRGWRVVEVTNVRTIGRTLAQGVGMSHNYEGPIELTKSGSVVISGAMRNDQNSQKITVWK